MTAVYIFIMFFLITGAHAALAQSGPDSPAATEAVGLGADNGAKAAGGKEVKISWAAAYNEALEEAKKTKKPLLIFVYASWCGWCKKMERETCADKNIVKLTGSFVCLKVNSEEDEEFSSKFKVKEFPCVVFLKSDGSEIERHLGFKTVEEFEAILKGVLKAAE
jgi:thiol:disulfide interchange protein